MNPFFSVIIPTYNRADRISKAVESVLQQTYFDFELIVVDDGSSDNTKEVISSYSDERIIYIYQENQERSVARNNGIEHAKGDFICFLDSDDYYLECHLQELRSFIKENGLGVAMYAAGTITFDEKSGAAYGRPIKMGKSLHPVRFIWNHFLLPDSVCIHKDILSENKFDPRFNVWEDTHLFLRIASLFPFYQLGKYTAVQVIHDEGTVAQNFADVKMITVNKYINAVEDLFENYDSIIFPHISIDEKKAYIISKIYLFKQFAYQNRQYNIVSALNKKAYSIHCNKKQYFMQQVIAFLKRFIG